MSVQDDMKMELLLTQLRNVAVRLREVADECTARWACVERNHPSGFDCGHKAHQGRHQRDAGGGRHAQSGWVYRPGREVDRGSVAEWAEGRRWRRKERLRHKVLAAQARWWRRARFGKTVAMTPVRMLIHWPSTLALVIVGLVIVSFTPLRGPVWGRIIPGSATECTEPTVQTAAYQVGQALRVPQEREPVTVEQAQQATTRWARAAWTQVQQVTSSFTAGVRNQPPPPPGPARYRNVPEGASGCAPCPGGGVYQASWTGGPLTDVQIAAAARQVGWPQEEIGPVTARVLAESSGDPTERDYLDGTHWGLLQLGPQERADYVPAGADPMDPLVNLAAGLRLWQERGWQPWQASDGTVGRYAARGEQAAASGGVAQASHTPAQPLGACAGTAGAQTRAAGSGSFEGRYPNGQIPPEELAALSWAPIGLRADAADGLERLNVAFRRQFGSNLAVTDGYRTLRQQQALWDGPKRSLAAKPGTSEHGWGVAVDLGSGVERFDTPQHAWMRANAAGFGWVHPQWAHTTKPEPWHWEYVGEGTRAG